MSEFSCGMLVKREHAKEIENRLSAMDVGVDCFFHEVNSSWTGLFLEDQWLQSASTLKLVKSLSETAPLLFFFDVDEHGWGYRVFAGGSRLPEESSKPGIPNLLVTEWRLRAQLEFRPSRHLIFRMAPSSKLKLVIEMQHPCGFGEPSTAREDFKELLGFADFAWMSYEYLLDEHFDD